GGGGEERVVAYGDAVVGDEHDQRARGVRVEVAGHAGQARHQAHEVGGEDEQAEGRDQGQVAPAFVTHDVVDHLLELLEQNLEEVLQAARHQLEVPRRDA